MRRWLQSAGVGILHLHGVDRRCRSHLDALLRARALPYLVTLHDLQFVNPRAFDAAGMPDADPDWIVEIGPTLERAATVIAPSAFILDIALLCSPGIRATIIPPGVRVAPAGEVPATPADFAAQAPRHVVGVVGAVGPHKGSGVLEALAAALVGSDIGIVVIGYTDTHLTRGWLVPGALYVHGAYQDGSLNGWLAAYRVETVLFPNRLPESFSYTLSEVWAAGLPVVVPDQGALGERVGRDGGGWLLPAGFDSDDAAALLVWLASAEGAAERTRVKSRIAPGDALRVPTLEAMSRDTDALYERFGLAPADAPDADAARRGARAAPRGESRRLRVPQGARQSGGRGGAGQGPPGRSAAVERGTPAQFHRVGGQARGRHRRAEAGDRPARRRERRISPGTRPSATGSRNSSGLTFSSGTHVRGVDVSIVTFRPDIPLLEKLIASIAEQAAGLDVNVLILDNSPETETTGAHCGVAAIAAGAASSRRVDIRHSPTNVGFGRGHNANAARCTAPFLFVLNQDCILEPGVLAPLLELAGSDERRVAAWELRQIPYEHPKAYDPVTLDVPWVSGAAALFRRSTFDAVGGFDPALFMYGEDVDLSWRLRAKGFRLRYVPKLAVVHRTYAVAGEVKPMQVLGGVLTNLCLRARYGGALRTLQGLSMLAGELLVPEDFPGRRRGLVKVFFRFVAQVAALRDDARPPDGALQAGVHGLGLRSAPRRRVRGIPVATRRAAPRSGPGVDPDPHRRPRRVAEAGAGIGRAADVAQHRGRRDRRRPADVAGDRRRVPRPARDPLPGDRREGGARARGQPGARRGPWRMAQFSRRRRCAVRRSRRSADGRGGGGRREGRLCARLGDADHRHRPRPRGVRRNRRTSRATASRSTG